jgi:hypothetical protein
MPAVRRVGHQRFYGQTNSLMSSVDPYWDSALLDIGSHGIQTIQTCMF